MTRPPLPARRPAPQRVAVPPVVPHVRRHDDVPHRRAHLEPLRPVQAPQQPAVAAGEELEGADAVVALEEAGVVLVEGGELGAGPEEEGRADALRVKRPRVSALRFRGT